MDLAKCNGSNFMKIYRNGKLRQQLQAAVQSIEWTYSVYWQLSPEEELLVWNDGFYNGGIKTRKTVQAMELTSEELCVERTLQLRELFESLSGGENNQLARRPCAALSPEDLTDTEWFYLISMSFEFSPSIGLPGRTLAKRRPLWICRANEVESKVFSRVLLAKVFPHIKNSLPIWSYKLIPTLMVVSVNAILAIHQLWAGIGIDTVFARALTFRQVNVFQQTVVCIPLIDGVLELGVTDLVPEDSDLVEHVKSFFIDRAQPIRSEHSASSPQNSDGSVVGLQSSESIISESQNVYEITAEDYQDEYQGYAGYYGSESIQADVSEVLTTGIQIPERNASLHRRNSIISSRSHPESVQIWPYSHENTANGVQAENMGHDNSVGDRNPQISATMAGPKFSHGMMPERNKDLEAGNHEQQIQTLDGNHYSKTLSTILQKPLILYGKGRNALMSSEHRLQTSVFLPWTNKGDYVMHNKAIGRSQSMLKNILFITRLQSVYNRDTVQNSPKFGDGENSNRNDFNAGHVLAERRRREKLNDRFTVLRSLVPFVTKADKASILEDTIDYLKQLQRRVQELEDHNEQIQAHFDNGHEETNGRLDNRPNGGYSVIDKQNKQLIDHQEHSNQSKKFKDAEQCQTTSLGKRKSRVVEGCVSSSRNGVEVCIPNIEVSIIDDEALLELKCGWREGLLLEILQTLSSLRLETYCMQSNRVHNCNLEATIKAKVRESPNGQKTTIVQVKEAIQYCFFR
eukprot:Gb_32265 [translate_table: standard]